MRASVKLFCILYVAIAGISFKTSPTFTAISSTMDFFDEDSLKNNSQKKNLKWLLLNSEWILTSGESDSSMFESRTLSFVSGNNYTFSDSIQLNPTLRLHEYDEYYNYKEAHFSFSFNCVFRHADNKISAKDCTNPHYGFWSLDSAQSEITLTFLNSKNTSSDDFNSWPIHQKYRYHILLVTESKLIIQKK